MTPPKSTRYIDQAHKLVPDILGLLFGLYAAAFAVYFGKLLIAEAEISLSDFIQLLILLFIAGTMFVGIWAQRKNKEFERSAAYLGNALALITKAKQVLLKPDGSPSNNRIAWVTSARLIVRAELLRCKITELSHQAIFAAEHDFHRHDFHHILKVNGSPLDASFFCGAPSPGMTIGEAVYDSTQEKNGQKWIPPRILAVVYRFFQYPETYEDPLQSVDKLSSREVDLLWMMDQKGVCDYITFRENFIPVSREVRQIISGSKPTKVSASEVTDQMKLLSGKWVE